MANKVVLILDNDTSFIAQVRAYIRGTKYYEEITLMGVFPPYNGWINGLPINEPDLVFVKWQMDYLKGPDVIETLRKRWGKKIVIILWGSDVTEECVAEALRHGASGAMEKPISRKDMIQVFNKYLSS